MATPKFAIFYADETVYEGGGEDDEMVEISTRVPRSWLEAPSDRVLFVVFEDPITGRVVLRGADFYYPFPEGGGGFSDDLKPFLRGNLPGLVKNGEYVSSERMGAGWQRVKAYDRIPRPGKYGPHPNDEDPE